MAIKFVDIEPEPKGERPKKADDPSVKREPDAEALSKSVEPELPHVKPAAAEVAPELPLPKPDPKPKGRKKPLR